MFNKQIQFVCNGITCSSVLMSKNKQFGHIFSFQTLLMYTKQQIRKFFNKVKKCISTVHCRYLEDLQKTTRHVQVLSSDIHLHRHFLFYQNSIISNRLYYCGKSLQKAS